MGWMAWDGVDDTVHQSSMVLPVWTGCSTPTGAEDREPWEFHRAAL